MPCFGDVGDIYRCGVVYVLLLAINALGSEWKNVVMWACCGV